MRDDKNESLRPDFILKLVRLFQKIKEEPTSFQLLEGVMLEHCGAGANVLVEVTALRLETVAISKHRHRILEATPKPLLYFESYVVSDKDGSLHDTGKRKNWAIRKYCGSFVKQFI